MYRKVLNIIDSPNALRKKSLCFPDFENWTTKDSECINDLTDTFEVIQGLGLAAPQIGILKRAIILNQRQLGISEDQEHLVMINPVLKLSGPTERNKEACFSVPHADGFVERHQVCEVSYIDKSGKQKSLTAEDVVNVMNNGVNSVTDQLVYYWNFNYGNGIIVEDQIGTNNGTITSASWVAR